MCIFYRCTSVLGIASIFFHLFEPVYAQSTTGLDPRDVEIGAGGNIRPEKAYRTDIEEEFDWHIHFLWEDRYVTEGRDNLLGNNIYSVSTEFTYKNLNIVPWVADSNNMDYSEFNLNIVYGTKPNDEVELFIGYNHIQSRESGSHFNDHEIGLDLAYYFNEQFHILTNIYYSFDAKGAFTEFSLNKSFQIDNSIIVSLRTLLGFNAGYVVNGHSGANHGQFLARMSYQIIDKTEAYAYSGYNLAIDRKSDRFIDDKLLRDFFWGGVGLSYRF